TGLRRLLLVIGCVTGLNSSVAASDFEAGWYAKERDSYAAAAEIWEPLAAEGDPRAQMQLAELYRHGLGVSRDIDRAVWLYDQAAQAGYAPAQVILGDLYSGRLPGLKAADGLCTEKEMMALAPKMQTAV